MLENDTCLLTNEQHQVGNAAPRRRRRKPDESPKPPAKGKRYARISKNLVVNGDLARVVLDYGITARDLYALVAIQADIQASGKRCRTYDSAYQMLKLLGWGDRARDYNNLDRALDVWASLRINIERYRDPMVTTLYGEGRDRLQSAMARDVKRGMVDEPVRREVFNGLMSCRPRDAQFCTICPDKRLADAVDVGYFIGAWPEVVKRLGNTPDILLYFLLEAFGGSLKMGLGKLVERMGMQSRRPGYDLGRVKKALGRIAEATEREYDCTMDKTGTVRIFRPMPKGGSKPDGQDRAPAKHGPANIDEAMEEAMRRRYGATH